MNNLHEQLSNKSEYYKKWHSNNYHPHVHWAGLAALAIVAGLFLNGAIQTAYVYAASLPSVLVMGTDHIPDFSLDPAKTQVSAVKSGLWSDASIWSSGSVPTPSQIALIPSGKTVTYDTTAGTAYTVAVYGTLQFQTDINTKLTVTNLEVMPSGYLEVGTPTNPVNPNVKAEIVIADTPIDLASDPEQWGTGFIGLGKVIMSGSVKNPTFVKVATEPLAGQSTITLAQAPTGWQMGDRIFIPDTRHLKTNEVGNSFWPNTPQWEEFTIQSINGTTITLNKPLAYNHKGARDVKGNLDFLPDVGNLTRNVIIRSANPTGTRGAVAMVHMANVDIRYVTFRDLGRTTYDPLSSTNQKGRYALHMHHLMGPMPTPANGYQYTLIGNAMDGGSSVHKYKWGITVHDSHFGLIQDNVVYNYAGAGVMTEDGSETMNVFDHNFVARVDGTGGRGDERGTSEFGYEGAGFWFRGPNNVVRNNVTANFKRYGIAYYSIYLGNVKIPNFKGADTSMTGQYTTVNSYTLTMPESSNNEMYGSGNVGFTTWWIGAEYNTARATSTSVVKNMKIWNVSDRGVYNYPSSKITYDGLKIRGSLLLSQGASCCGVGYEGGDYFSNDVFIKNSDIQGMTVGIDVSTMTKGTQLIENTTLGNAENIHVATQWTSSCDARGIPPRLTVIKNTKFLSPSGVSAKNINMAYTATEVRNLIQKDEVYVVDYNGTPGDNFRVFYKQADPNFIVPQGYYSNLYGPQCVSFVSTPVGGLTNAQSYAQYGYAVAGTPATCADVSTHPEIGGFICPFTTLPTSLTPIVTPTGFIGGPITGTTGSTSTTTTTYPTPTYPTPTTTSAPTITLTANPLVITAGQSSVLAWSAANATTCNALGGWSGEKALSGSLTVVPTGTTSYTLSCTGTGGTSSKMVTITVNAPTGTTTTYPTPYLTPATEGSTTTTTTPKDTTAPVISGVTKMNITTNSAMILWTTDEPATGQIEFIGACPTTGCVTQMVTTLSTSHSFTVTNLAPSTTYTFRLRSQDASGNLKVASAESFAFTTAAAPVETVAAPSVSFSATPTSISGDGYATLSWTTKNATSVSIDNGIGPVDVNGKLNVAPKTTTTYTVTANGSTKVSASVTVTVVPVVAPTISTSLSPLAFWKFNSDAGTSAADSSGNGYGGELVNNPAWTTGHSGGAILFDGVNDYVGFGANSAFNLTGDMTVAAWIYADVPTEVGGLVSKGGCWNTSCPFNFRITHGGNVCFDQNNGGSGQDSTCTTNTVSFGSWTHVAATRSGNTINIYINGSLVQTRTAERAATANTSPVRVGTVGSIAGTSFKGKIDDIELFSKALSASDIRTIMNQ